MPQRVRPAITAWPTIDGPLSLVDGARRGRASLFMARRLILCGTNLIVYDNVHSALRAPYTDSGYGRGTWSLACIGSLSS